MVRCTQSLRHWLFENGYKEELVLIEFGHTEYLTEDMWNRYIEWCKTDEGKEYLQGGKYYEDENVRGKRSKIFEVVDEDGQIRHIDLNDDEYDLKE